jgi:hypothetical protein
MKLRSIINNTIYKIEGLDVRSVALFRIVLGLGLISYIILMKWIPAKEYLAPSSTIFGNEYLKIADDGFMQYSLMKYIHTDFGYYAFLLTTIISLFLYVIGVFPKLFAIVSYILFNAILLRFYVINTVFGWEKYLELLLFFSVFLPINQQFTIIKVHSNNIKENYNRSFFSYLFLFQIGVIYMVSALSKSGDYWIEGNAVQVVLNTVLQIKPLAYLINSNTFICKFFNYATLISEFLIFIFLFIPFNNKYFRILAAFIILFLHWGIYMFLEVGFFVIPATAVFAVLIPSFCWNYNLLKVLNEISKNIPTKIINIKVSNLYINIKNILTISLGVYFLIFIIHQNIRKFYGNDKLIGNYLYEKGIIQFLESHKLPIIKQIYFFKQSWGFYSPNPHTETSFFKIIGYAKDDDRAYVIKNEPNFDINAPYDLKYSSSLDELLWIELSIHVLNKEYFQPVLINIFRNKLNQWQQTNKNISLKEVKLYYYSLKLENKSIVRKKIYINDFEKFEYLSATIN